MPARAGEDGRPGRASAEGKPYPEASDAGKKESAEENGGAFGPPLQAAT